MYSKLCHLGPVRYEIADGEPYRSREFMQLLPNVISESAQEPEYGAWRYDNMLAFEQHNGIPTTPKWGEHCAGFEGDTLLIQANKHLEMGRRLEDWMSDLPTNFHYELKEPKPHEIAVVDKHLAGLRRPIIGISAASYRGSEAWKTWGFEEWSTFLDFLVAETGGSILLMGGFWDDLTYSLASLGHRECVGKTSAGACLNMLKRLDYYVGFSSGLGVLRTVMRKNAFLLWPDFQHALSTSWAPLDMLENRQYVAHLWRDPKVVQRTAYMWLKANAC